jgi:hypothetical protein
MAHKSMLNLAMGMAKVIGLVYRRYPIAGVRASEMAEKNCIRTVAILFQRDKQWLFFAEQ